MKLIGIEIGGTKLQVGTGAGDGKIVRLWRGTVEKGAGPGPIRRQIESAITAVTEPVTDSSAKIDAVGIGFGGPVNDADQSVIKSHQIAGWDNFPLGRWVSNVVGAPAILGNDADVAG